MGDTNKVAPESGGVAQWLEHRLHKPVDASVRVEFDLANDAYHAHENLGSTDLKVLGKSAALFWGKRSGEIPSTDSPSLALGRLWHDLLDLSPEVWGERAVVVPQEYCLASGGVSTKRDAKEWLASLPADAIPVTPSISDQLGRMLDGFLDNSAAADIYAEREFNEVSIFWDWGGVPVKCRPDAITASGLLADYKTTSLEDIRREFGSAVKRYGYGLSQALYEEGCRVSGLARPPMHFIVTSTTTYETQVMTLPPAYVADCRDQLLRLLAEYARRVEQSDWLPTGYGKVIECEMWGYGDRRDIVQ